MSTHDDGGPAFPNPERSMSHFGNAESYPGMSLRQYYAGQIAQGDAAADEGWAFNSAIGDEQIAGRVRLYFRIADAMISEGAK